MKVSIEMDNLNKLVQSALTENIETVIKEQVDIQVRKLVSEQINNVVSGVVNKNMEQFVQDYISNAEIKVGGGFYSKEPEEVYTVEQFIKKELASVLEDKTLKIKKVGRSSSYADDYEKVSFQEYINRKFDPTALIQKELSSFIEGTKKDINRKIDDAFTSTTKSMLSETVFNLLTKNDTFRKIQDNVKCIADKKD